MFLILSACAWLRWRRPKGSTCPPRWSYSKALGHYQDLAYWSLFFFFPDKSVRLIFLSKEENSPPTPPTLLKTQPKWHRFQTYFLFYAFATFLTFVLWRFSNETLGASLGIRKAVTRPLWEQLGRVRVHRRSSLLRASAKVRELICHTAGHSKEQMLLRLKC